MYMTGGSRILYATGETAAGPRWLTTLNSARAPWVGVLVMWAVGVLFLLPFPAWQLMVSYITSVTVITYGLGPIVLLVLRRTNRRFGGRSACGAPRSSRRSPSSAATGSSTGPVSRPTASCTLL